MSKSKTTTKTRTKSTKAAPAQSKVSFSYNSLEQLNFYKAVQPNITSYKDGIVYFNSDDTSEDNAYPNKIIDYAKNKSSVHSNFLNLKTALLYGSGLYPVDESNQECWDFINKPNQVWDTVNDVVRKMCSDASWFDAGSFQVLYSEFGNGHIAEVVHTDVSKLRAQTPNSLNVIENWYFKSNWGTVDNAKIKGSNKVDDAEVIPSFKPATETTDARQLCYFKRYTPGNDVYAIPSYNSSLNWVEIEYQLSQFHLNKITSGFFPSYLITMFSNPPEEERDKFAKDFKGKLTGAGKAGNGMITYADGLTNAPKVDRLTADPNDGMFESLSAMAAQKIATAHGGDLLLAGIEGKGSDLGGDANKINVSRLAFLEHVIIPMQNIMLAQINKVFKANKLCEVVIYNQPLRLVQPELQPEDLTRDERREIIMGLEPYPTETKVETPAPQLPEGNHPTA